MASDFRRRRSPLAAASTLAREPSGLRGGSRGLLRSSARPPRSAFPPSDPVRPAPNFPRRNPPVAGSGAGVCCFDRAAYFGTFCQSSRNRFRPTSVSACCVIFFSTSKGSVTMSAPSFAASITWSG